jgi:hypothetical protein
MFELVNSQMVAELILACEHTAVSAMESFMPSVTDLVDYYSAVGSRDYGSGRLVFEADALGGECRFPVRFILTGNLHSVRQAMPSSFYASPRTRHPLQQGSTPSLPFVFSSIR